MRLHIPESGLCAYPDSMIICGEIEFLSANKDTLLNPKVIVEVLSGRQYG